MLADIVRLLLDDHAQKGHRLNATDALLDVSQRPRALQLLAEMGRGAIIAQHSDGLPGFLTENPGSGPVFEPIDQGINQTSENLSRKAVFEAEARQRDPARSLNAASSTQQLVLLDDYRVRLARRVQPAAQSEIDGLVARIAEETGTSTRASARTKSAAGILDKVRRMTKGRPGKPGRPDFRVGDVVDAVGLRVTVRDMRGLEVALATVIRHFGVGDGGRILEIENMYARPKAAQPAYRVIPMVVAIDVDGLAYTYELQLTTERASLAADVEHNTVYKPYVELDDEQKAVVLAVMAEAAALDQLETVERDDDG